MRTARFTIAVLIAISSCYVDTALSNDPQSPAVGPLDVLNDCIAAIQDGDYGRYVDHLAADEQRLQAGYALVVTRLLGPGANAGAGDADPATLLLARALSDLVKQHVNEAYAAQQVAAQAGPQPLVPVLTWAGNDARISPPATGAYCTPAGCYVPYDVTSNLMLGVCAKSADQLKDDREYLIAVMGELCRETQISGNEPATSTASVDLRQIAKGYAEAKWTLYTRGDYAIAVAALRQTEDAPTTKPNGPQSVQPPSAESPQVGPRVEFQRVDGKWKISHLLDASVRVMATSPSATPTATFDPYRTAPATGYAPPHPVQPYSYLSQPAAENAAPRLRPPTAN